jgi:MscS family membrane protein
MQKKYVKIMFLEKIYYGNSLESWIISAAIIIGVLVVNKILAIAARGFMNKVSGKTRTNFIQIVVLSALNPVLLGLALLGIYIALCRLNLHDNIHAGVTTAYKFLSVLNITWLISRLVSGLAIEYFEKGIGGKKPKIDARLFPMLKRIVVILIWIIGFISALNGIGVQLTTVLGALGIGGLATALAAQDTIKNIFGGFTIFADQQYRIGDVIVVGEYEGTVENIGLRSTRLRLHNKQLVVIPNGKMIDASIQNISAEPERRVLMELGLTYDTTPEKMQQAMKILTGIAVAHPDVDEQETIVTFSAFADSALVIKFIYYIKKGASVLMVPSAVNMEILQKFNAAGLNFAYPSRTIYVNK